MRFPAHILLACSLVLCLGATSSHASIFSQVHGVVHDPQHRPVSGATVQLQSSSSSFLRSVTTGPDGTFSFASVPLGLYSVTVTERGFETMRQSFALQSDTSPNLHFELSVQSVSQTVSVVERVTTTEISSATPTTLIDRRTIAETPGADRTNSLAMITDYVPGAYITHDQLHVRGGHQVSWQIDGVQIPNTNIASNLGPQIDPKDIDYVEAERGSYRANDGDRTYGIFNVVPRTGFERDRQGELVVSAGSFAQTNDQISFGDHTDRFAWYTSLNGNRSDDGLSPPVATVTHDAANGFGGFGSMIFNVTSKDQLRLVSQLRTDHFQVPFDPDPADAESKQFDSSGLRDAQDETDALTAFTWLRTVAGSTVLQVSPFYHFNSADYRPGALDTPVGSRVDRASQYAGAQLSATAGLGRHTLEAGVYSFGQHDAEYFAVNFREDPSRSFARNAGAGGGLVEQYLSDSWRATEWLTLTAGVRASQFRGAVSESVVAPRFGIALRVKKLNWVLRGFYGHFYQPPPLLTASGPLLVYAQATNTTFAPLSGERDEEHQFGVEIPVRGWVLDADTFRTRASHFLDHAVLGESSIYFPVTVDGALVRAWELTLRSPATWRFGQMHLAYSNQIAEQRGALTGGLICAPVSSPQCDVQPGYTPLDHDQRNTLNIGFNAHLPYRLTAAADVAYGSGFVNGEPDPATAYPNAYLPQHTSVDLSLGKSVGERVTVTVSALNVADQRVLLDNSVTFGGFHFSDPRQIFAEVRYRFHFSR